jgi:hypothetical protein
LFSYVGYMFSDLTYREVVKEGRILNKSIN